MQDQPTHHIHDERYMFAVGIDEKEVNMSAARVDRQSSHTQLAGVSYADGRCAQNMLAARMD